MKFSGIGAVYGMMRGAGDGAAQTDSQSATSLQCHAAFHAANSDGRTR